MPDAVGQTCQRIMRAFFRLNEGQLGLFLSVSFIQTSTDFFSLTQHAHIEVLIIKCGLEQAAEMLTSMPVSFYDKILSHEDDKIFNVHLHQAIIGSLIHVVNRCSPNISFTVSILAQFSKIPKIFLSNAAKISIRFLKGSKNYGLQLQF